MDRKEINDRVVAWIIHLVKTEYADDVSLVLLYGSYINGTANSRSDVDCYYIPKTARGYDLQRGFIIDGVGYDLFPMSWERVAGIADLEESLLPLVGDVQVAYYADPCDLARFSQMQARMRSHLADDAYVRTIARERCVQAAQWCAWMKQSDSLSEVRELAGHVIMTLADAVAIRHHDYFHLGLKKQYEDLAGRFPDIPPSVVSGYQQVVASPNIQAVRRNTLALLTDICQYLQIPIELPEDTAIPQTVVAENVDAASLARLYEEISATFRKIDVCCENGNAILAFLSAVCLQRELDDAREAGSPAYDLLSCFDDRQLGRLAEKARRIEADFVQWITSHGGHIRAYAEYASFVQAEGQDA